MKETELFRLPSGTIAKLKMKSIDQIIKDKGLDPHGDVQKFHTANVLRRITKYMPFRTGMTIKATIAQTNINKPQIVTNTPYAKYLYYGKAMTGKAPKVAIGKNLTYTKTKNKQAGPFWDRRLVANEKDVIVQEVTDYINKK